MGGGHQVDVVAAVCLEIEHLFCQLSNREGFSFGAMGELVILTKTAFEGAVGEKNSPRTPRPRNWWLFAVVRENTGDDQTSGRAAKPAFVLPPVNLAPARAQFAGGGCHVEGIDLILPFGGG
jgi:hypothetical protein